MPLFTLVNVQPPAQIVEPRTLAVHEISLADRYPEPSINVVFTDNILLTLAYIENQSIDRKHVDWETIRKPATYQFALEPGETFAFHDDVLPEYSGVVDRTTNAHFVLSEGFRSSGYLAGDGVCHLASLLYWTAKDAGLDATAPTDHSFRQIPGIPKEYGVSIFTIPGKNVSTNQRQNLYITNSRNDTVTFHFQHEGNILSAKITEHSFPL